MAARQALAGAAQAGSAELAPTAPVHDVTETHFGTTVSDPYRYLENLADPQVSEWLHAQNDYGRRVLAQIPGRDALLARMHELVGAVAARVGDIRRLSNGLIFYLMRRPQDDVPKLYVRQGLTGSETPLVDPDTLRQATGRPHAINYYEPSPDGTYVVYGVSAGDSEDVTLYVLE